jgi:amylosucrase
VFAAFRVLAEARKRLIMLRAGADVRPLPTDDRHVFAYLRRHPRSGPFLGLANFDDEPRSCDASILAGSGLGRYEVVTSSGEGLHVAHGRVHLPAWGFAWLVA